MNNYMWCTLLPILFLTYSLPLFLRVYGTTKNVIDEEFHLRQGLHYCNKRFNVWDRKITTFPGLYMAALVLTPFDWCSVLGLRLISLVAATFNVILLYKIRYQALIAQATYKCASSMAALDAFTLAALPPMYFFSHLYYTDILALTMVLSCYYYWLKKSHLQSSIYAAGSVLMRQTNIVWIGMICGITILDVFRQNYAAKHKLRLNNISIFNIKIWLKILKSGNLFWQSLWQIIQQCGFYMIIILPFIAFIFVNGSIVLGDKQAHRVTLHLPQLFYFALFTLVFGVNNTLQQFRTAIKLISSEKALTLFVTGVCILIVKYNTIVHPYLLADNRHYIFYIWNRFYGPLPWFRYAMVPIYVTALIIIYHGMRHMSESFRFMYAVAVFLALCFQQLLELRYFLVPYIIFRLHTPAFTTTQWPKQQFAPQWLELAAYIFINAITFYIFFNKEIMWSDYKEPQHIIW